MITAEVLPDRAFRAFTVAKRFQKFLLVGAVGLVVNQVMLVALHDGADLPLAMASVLGIAISMVVTFLLNEIWTWHDRGGGPIVQRLASYIPINSVGLAINTIVLLILVNQFSMHKLLANLIGAGLAAIWNFCLNSAITWRT